MKSLIVWAAMLGALMATSLVSKLHINEHGAEYDEDIEYDPDTRAVSITVPPRHHIVGQTLIIHTDSVRQQQLSIGIITVNILCLFRTLPFPLYQLKRFVSCHLHQRTSTLRNFLFSL